MTCRHGITHCPTCPRPMAPYEARRAYAGLPSEFVPKVTAAGTVRLTVTLPRATLAEMNAEADRLDRNLSWVVQAAIREAVRSGWRVG